MPKGSSFPNLLFHDPSHSPSVFVLFIFNPEKEPNFSSRENKDIAEESSRVKVVVSSALQTKFSHAGGSTARVKSNAEKGHPCLQKERNKSEVYPLFTTQLVVF